MRPLTALWRATHPGPTLVVTALALALGLSIGLPPGRLALLVVAVFCGQLSVGLSNDAIDAHRDRAVGRTDKPIAAGVVAPGVALQVAVATLVIALGASVPLGAGFVAAHAFSLASAWIYNAGAKATPLSVVPFVVSFGVFPSFATLAAPEPHLAPGWAWVAGSALGAAMHLTNVLPDLDDDEATGIRGLPHRLGARVSALTASACLLVGALAVLLAPGGTPSAVAWPFFAAAVLAAIATAGGALLRRPGRALFRLAMLAALLLAAQLVVSGPALLG
jgi:4-hydroxybenzoate polyprenyltransferase